MLTDLNARNVGGHRAGQETGGGDRQRAEDPDGVVHPFGDEGSCRDRPPVLGLGQETHLGHRGIRHVAEVHQGPGGEANPFDELTDHLIALDGGGVLVTAQTYFFSRHAHDRHTVVDAGHLYPFDHVHRVTRG